MGSPVLFSKRYPPVPQLYQKWKEELERHQKTLQDLLEKQMISELHHGNAVRMIIKFNTAPRFNHGKEQFPPGGVKMLQRARYLVRFYNVHAPKREGD